jgi:hypothetical protein
MSRQIGRGYCDNTKGTPPRLESLTGAAAGCALGNLKDSA